MHVCDNVRVVGVVQLDDLAYRGVIFVEIVGLDKAATKGRSFWSKDLQLLPLLLWLVGQYDGAQWLVDEMVDDE